MTQRFLSDSIWDSYYFFKETKAQQLYSYLIHVWPHKYIPDNYFLCVFERDRSMKKNKHLGTFSMRWTLFKALRKCLLYKEVLNWIRLLSKKNRLSYSDMILAVTSFNLHKSSFLIACWTTSPTYIKWSKRNITHLLTLPFQQEST